MWDVGCGGVEQKAHESHAAASRSVKTAIEVSRDLCATVAFLEQSPQSAGRSPGLHQGPRVALNISSVPLIVSEKFASILPSIAFAPSTVSFSAAAAACSASAKNRRWIGAQVSWMCLILAWSLPASW